MDSSTMRRRFGRPLAAAVAATALALGGVAAAAPASAADTPVTGAVFRWGINAESNAAAFAPGTYNLLSAGVVTATSAADRVTTTNWKQADGDVEILKLQADGTYADATFAGLRTDAAGTTITTGNGLNSGHVAEFGAGTGTVDVAAGTASIQWTGTVTSAYYSGMTRSWITDPKLTVADGTGTITATLGGYGTSMDDPEKFETLTPATNVTVATLSDVTVTDTGFTVTADYLGRTVTTGADAVPQVTTGTAFGAFPQSFVDFQVKTGQGPYWYSSGGAADARKPASPITVSYTVAAQPATPTVTVSKTSGIAKGETVTVTGSGFLPSGTATSGTRPPLAGQFTGAYVAFGKYATNWKPSAGAASSARVNIVTKWALPVESHATVGGANAGAIELTPDGTFSVELTLSPTAAQDLAAGNYGIYTYPGGGATYAPFETYTPLSFSGANDVEVEIPEWVDTPSGSFGWAFAGTSPANLGTATQSGANFVASGSLSNIVVTDDRAGGSGAYSWSISGQAAAFASGSGSTFSGALLGWTPKIVAGGSSVTKGADVTSTQLGGAGLGTSRVLASSNAAASATIGADLSLVIPGTTAAGDYSSTLTITALQ